MTNWPDMAFAFAIGIWLTNVLWMRRSRRTRERWDLQAKEMRQSDDAAYKRLHDQALSDATALDAARRENLDLLAECVNFKRLLMQDPVIRARADAFNWSRGDDDGDN